MVLPAAFYCPITQEVMQDPVVALDGQSYEYAAIITWFEANQISPVTKATLRAKTLVRNFALRSTIWELVGIPGPWVEIAGCEEPIAYEEPSEALEVPPPLDGNGNEMERIGTESVGDGVAAHTSGPAAVCKAVTHSSSHPEYEELNGEYHCRYPGCNRVFKLPGALHTHTGWHKRKENIDNGVYDRLGHHLKETHSVADAHGRVSVLEVYRCDHPGCGKLFQGRDALNTHRGWHKRRPKNDQASLMRPSKRSINSAAQTPRKHIKGGVGVGPAMGMTASTRPAVPGMMPYAPMGIVAPPVDTSGFFRQQVPAPQHSVPSRQPDTKAALALRRMEDRGCDHFVRDLATEPRPSHQPHDTAATLEAAVRHDSAVPRQPHRFDKPNAVHHAAIRHDPAVPRQPYRSDERGHRQPHRLCGPEHL